MNGLVLAPHLHLDKLRYLKVTAQLPYGALCPSDDEFHLSGPWDTELVLAGRGTLCTPRCSMSPGRVSVHPQCSPPGRTAQVSALLCTRSSWSSFTWTTRAGKISLLMPGAWDAMGCKVLPAATGDHLGHGRGRWHERDKGHLPTDAFVLRLLRLPFTCIWSGYRLMQGGFYTKNWGINTQIYFCLANFAGFFFSLLPFFFQK